MITTDIIRSTKKGQEGKCFIEIPAMWVYHHGDPQQVLLKVADDITVSVPTNEETNHVCKNFRDWSDLMRKSPNKIGVLVTAFKVLHNNAPANELEKVGGQMAGFARSVRQDYDYALKLIWDAAAIPITGKHLSYIQGMARGKKNAIPKQRSVSYSSISDLKKDK